MYVSEPLGVQHDTATFACGHRALDVWLDVHARTAAAKRVGRTFVWHDSGVVVAYYTLSAHLLVRDDVPRKLSRGDPDAIPAVLLARLALDERLRGKGLGGALLADALARVVRAAEQVAARYVVVDAIDEAAVRFYEHFGFRRTPIPDRLVRKVGDIALDLQGR